MNWKCDGDADCEGGEDEPEGECSDVAVHACDESYFRCKNNRCVPGRWRCDHDDDCGDGSDEIGCLDSYRNCSVAEIMCSDGFCVHENKICDGRTDCKDGSDELFCDVACQEGQFRCHRPPACIMEEWHCDGEWDCSDGSDEAEDCPGKDHCETGEIPCANNSTCVNAQWICDGQPDCPDGSDERDCEGRVCEPNRFRCSKGGVCVLWPDVCDGERDCPDGSDEAPESCDSSCQGFKCDNGKCVDRRYVCDGKTECTDGSDEADCEPPPPCSFGACSQQCEVKLHRDHGQSINTRRNASTAECSCSADGYSLEAKKICKTTGDNATLVMANENALRHMDPYGLTQTFDVEEEKSEGAAKIQSVEVYYDKEGNTPVIVWSVRDARAIYFHRQVVGGTRNVEEGDDGDLGVLVPDVDDPKGLSVDWVAGNLYYLEGATDSVYAFNLESKMRTRLDSIGLDNPQDVAVDPKNGKLYVADYGANPKIVSASMDGRGQQRTLAEAKIQMPASLVLDSTLR